MFASTSSTLCSDNRFDIEDNSYIRKEIGCINLVRTQVGNLLTKAEKLKIDVRQQFKSLTELDLPFTSKNSKFSAIKLRARFIGFCRIRNTLQFMIKEFYRNTPPQPPMAVEKSSGMAKDLRVGLRECTSRDIEISESYLQDWTEKAKAVGLNIEPILSKLSSVKALRDSYIPVEGAESNAENFKVCFYIHYLNAYCNKIIRKVCIAEIHQLAEKGRQMEILRGKEGFVNAEEKLMIAQIPRSRSLYSPIFYTDKCQSVISSVPERLEKIIHYKIQK